MSPAADRLRRLSKAIQTVPEQGVKFGVQVVRTAGLSDGRTDSGGDLKLSGLRNGKQLTVTTKVVKLGKAVTGEAKAGPQKQRAPWFWMRSGTQGSMRTRAANKKKSSKAYSYPHPGTPGKGTWDRSVPAAIVKARDKFAELHTKANNA